MKKRKKLSKAERWEVYEKCAGHCAYCGAPIQIKDMQADHIVALERGGADTVDNMLPACRSCNHFKSASTIETFRRMIEDWPRVLARDSITYKNAVRYGLVLPNPKPIKFYFETMEVRNED